VFVSLLLFNQQLTMTGYSLFWLLLSLLLQQSMQTQTFASPVHHQHYPLFDVALTGLHLVGVSQRTASGEISSSSGT